jgi:hypothetical protein
VSFSKMLTAFSFQDATPEMVRQARQDVDKALANGLMVQAKRLDDVGLSTRCVMSFVDKVRQRVSDAMELGTNNLQFKELYAAEGDAGSMAKLAQSEVDAQLRSVFQGTVGAITTLLGAAEKQIGKIDGDNDPSKEGLAFTLGELRQQLRTIQSQQQNGKTRDDLNGLEKQARGLLEAVSKKTRDTDLMQQAFHQALVDRYQMKVAIPKNFSNTHFDKLYAMFAEVPVDHVVHPQLKLVEYSTTLEKDTAEFGSATIRMGDFGTDPKDMPYKTKTEGFSISTLHEIGHSVDARHGIMPKCQESNNCGNWKKSSVDEVAQAVYLQIAGNWVGNAMQTPQQKLVEAVKAVLATGELKAPKDIDQSEWGKFVTTLSDCVLIREDQSPWDAQEVVAFGGRAYLESYKNDWWSYNRTSRTGANTVRGYQWRAPGEWFADLYAFSWYHKKPVAGIDQAPAAFMYKE